MKILDSTIVVLLAACLATPLAASEFEVVAASGAKTPEKLKAGQKLTEGTSLGFEAWGRAVIRETAKCGLTHVVVGVADYALELTENCAETEDPMSVVVRIQQGDVFAARLEKAESGPAADVVTALSHDPCVYLARFSEEDEGGRQCPSGYALNGLRCSGAYCDNKDLMCCRYLDGAADQSTKQIQARQISEEFPNSMTTKRFLNGLTCHSAYCDDLVPHAFKSERLANAKKCEWSAWSSEQPGAWLVCGGDRFVAGLRCKGDYCADVGISCCQARVE